MAEALKSYVEKFILNPNPKFLDEENGVSEAKIEESSVNLLDERRKETEVQVSKLRSLNAPSLSDKNPKYGGQQIVRQNLQSNRESDIVYDPMQAKLLDDDDEVEGNTSNSGSECGENIENDESNKSFSNSEESNESLCNDEESNESLCTGNDEDSVCSDNNELISKRKRKNAQELPIDTNKHVLSLESEAIFESNVQTFAVPDESSIEKANAVKNQISLFESLFEFRIGLQKAVTNSNRLPQGDNFKQFSTSSSYKANLVSARMEAKKLLTQLLSLQDSLLTQNSETNNIKINIENDKLPVCNGRSTLEIDATIQSGSANRKRKIEDLGTCLNERHNCFEAFRDTTLNKWYNISKSLNAKRGHSNFSGFESSSLQQLKQILMNPEPLIKRTRLVSVERNNQMKVIGVKEDEDADLTSPEYNPESFDDTDFYSQQLEAILYSKMSTNGTGGNMVGSLANVAAMRSKISKKKADPRFNKGRKLKFKIMYQMQNYLAPCRFSSMNDDTIDKLFGSLFVKTSANAKR